MANNTLPTEEAQGDFGYVGKITDPTGKRKKAWYLPYFVIQD